MLLTSCLASDIPASDILATDVLANEQLSSVEVFGEGQWVILRGARHFDEFVT